MNGACKVCLFVRFKHHFLCCLDQAYSSGSDTDQAAGSGGEDGTSRPTTPDPSMLEAGLASAPASKRRKKKDMDPKRITVSFPRPNLAHRVWLLVLTRCLVVDVLCAEPNVTNCRL